MPLILGTNSIKDTGYNVANSCRFDDGSSTQMNKTISSTSTTWTFSCWIKFTPTTLNQYLLSWDLGGGESVGIGIERTTASTQLFIYNSATGQAPKLYDGKLRDPSAWYNIVIKNSSGTITSYINGTQANTSITGTALASGTLRIGCWTGSNFFYNGYMSEVVLIDGTAYSADSFGEFDEDSPTVFKPIDVSGLTFGSDGFYLDFEDSSNLGNDANGGTDLTEANLTAVDQSTDTCTLNYSTLNPLTIGATAATLGEGNTSIVGGANNAEWYTASTIAPSTGKWYVEIRNDFASGQAADLIVGFTTNLIDVKNEAFPGKEPHSLGLWSAGTDVGDIKIDNSVVSNQYTGDWGSANKILGMALDLDNKIVYFSIDGVFQSSGNPSAGSGGYDFSSSLTPFEDNYFIAIGSFTNSSNINQCSINFGSPSFAISSGNSDGNGYGNFEYAVPSGYYALNSKNLAEYG